MFETKKKKPVNPARIISVSFLAVILTGTLLLILPISSRDGLPTNFLSCLFTATSATCVTGLVLFDTYSKWTPFGQGVILMLIQIGGLGIVTFTSFFNLAIGRKLGLRSMQLASESINSSSFGEVPKLLRMVVTFTLTVEFVGACLLSLYFVPDFGTQGLLISIFLSVSAFCNAGFDILGFQGAFSSLTPYNGNYLVIITISMLIIIGGVGFIVWNDIINWRKGKGLLLHTKIVLFSTVLLILVGMLMILIFEWDNPLTLLPLNLKEKMGAGLFQSVTMRTAGFNSIDIAGMREITKSFAIMLMFVGAAPGSTGGGIKVTTLAVIIMTALSMIRGQEDPVILKRRIPAKVVYKSIAILFLGVLVVGVTSGIVALTTPIDEGTVTGIDAVFESVSAFATVGLSSGVTGISTPLSQIALIFSMFIGRVGPVAFGMSIAAQQYTSRKTIIPDGKIIVG